VPEFDVQKGKPNSEEKFGCEKSDANGTVSGTATAYYDENGIRYKWVEEYTDGFYYIAEYASNGGMTYSHSGYADGSSTEQFYDEFGNETKRISNDIYGNHIETTLHPNGIRASTVVNYGDGRYSEEYWTKSGVPISSISIGADGYQTACTWYENGNQKSYVEDGTEGHFESYFFEDGTLSKLIGRRSSGEYYEEVYYANGQVASRIDSYGEKYYDENGKLTYEKYQDSNSSYLFENGALVYYIYMSDGEEITDPEQLALIAIALGLVS